jgi:hypothetical protein
MDMPSLKLKQLQYEIDAWKRQLSFMRQENVHLKNRLSDVLKDKFNKNLLDDVEGFQSSFIKEDELISFLRNEVAEIDDVLLNEIFISEKINMGFDKNLHQLRNNLLHTENDFVKIKMAFYNYLSEHI